jgi:hypothetical protein
MSGLEEIMMVVLLLRLLLLMIIMTTLRNFKRHVQAVVLDLTSG